MNAIADTGYPFEALLGSVLALRAQNSGGAVEVVCTNVGPYHVELQLAAGGAAPQWRALSPGAVDVAAVEFAREATEVTIAVDLWCREGEFGDGAVVAVAHAVARFEPAAVAASEDGVALSLRPEPAADGFCGAWLESATELSPRTTLLVQTDGGGVPLRRQFLCLGDGATLGRSPRTEWRRGAVTARWLAEGSLGGDEVFRRNLAIHRDAGRLEARASGWALLPDDSASGSARVAVDGRQAGNWRALPLGDGSSVALGDGEPLRLRVRLPEAAATTDGLARELLPVTGGPQTLVLERVGNAEGDTHAVLRRIWVAGSTRATAAFHVPDLPPRSLVLLEGRGRFLVATNADAAVARVAMDGCWLTPHVLYTLPARPRLEVFDARTGERRLVVMPMQDGVDKRAGRREDLPPPELQLEVGAGGAIGVAAAESDSRFGRLLEELRERVGGDGTVADDGASPRVLLAAATALASLRQAALDSSLQSIAFLAKAFLEYHGERTLALLEQRVRASTITCRAISQFLGLVLAGVPVRTLFPGRADMLAGAVAAFETAAAVFFAGGDRRQATTRVHASADALLAALAALHDELLAQRHDVRGLVRAAVATVRDEHAGAEAVAFAPGDEELAAFAVPESLTAALAAIVRAARSMTAERAPSVRILAGDTSARACGIAVSVGGSESVTGAASAIAEAVREHAVVLVDQHAFAVDLADDGRSVVLWVPRLLP